MPDYALAIAGVFVFAVTTWASLVIGYEVFQHLWEVDSPDVADAAGSPTEGRALAISSLDVQAAQAARASADVLHRADSAV